MNEIYMIIFITIIFSFVYTVQAYGISTSTISQEEVDKLLNDEYQKTPFSGELNLYSILTILVVATVIILKFAITNTGIFQKKTELYREYEQDKTAFKKSYSDWSEERISDLKLEVKDQKRLLEMMQNEINKIVMDVKSHKDILIAVKDDVVDIKSGVKSIQDGNRDQENTLGDLKVKIAVIEKLFDRNRDSGGGK